MGVARIAILALAALAAGVAAFLVQGLISSNGDKSDKKTATLNVTEVLVAAHDLNLGQQVTPSDVRWQPWPEGAITPAYMVKSKDAQAMQKTVGGTVRQAMLAGEPLTEQKVVQADGAGFMSAILAPGMRAVSVAISVETGAGGFILPNDRVDVILTSRGAGNSNSQDSRTILNNVRILAIDQTYREEGGNKVVIGKTATVELSPGQAESLAQAAASGVVSLSLRSIADVDPKKGASRQTSYGGSVTILRYGSPSRVTLSGVDQ